jgi:hypothetical protein
LYNLIYGNKDELCPSESINKGNDDVIMALNSFIQNIDSFPEKPKDMDENDPYVITYCSKANKSFYIKKSKVGTLPCPYC